MADTTTIKVNTSTRDLLLELGAARRESADQVIRAALAAMKRDERRQIAAAEARAIKDDPVDLAEIKAIQQDLAALQQTSRGVRSTGCPRVARAMSSRDVVTPSYCNQTGSPSAPGSSPSPAPAPERPASAHPLRSTTGGHW